ncbi:MAG: proline dehydrogenase family protein [Flavobacteriales bacterium]|nr:proline dehydrogenase family protein [Flavobacteriales bacterium]
MSPTERTPNQAGNLPDFENTEQAFAHLNSRQLKKALVLFRTVGNPTLVKLGKLLMNLALVLRIPVAWAIRPTVYSHFCGGESIAGCESTISSLASSDVKTILDYSAEGKDSEAEWDRTHAEIMRAIQATEGDDRHAFSVFKVSGLASTRLLEKVGATLQPLAKIESVITGLSHHEKEAWKRVQARFYGLCEHSARVGKPVFIDAEESWIQPTIDAMAESAMRRWNGEETIVYNTVQLYRTDRLDYLKKLIETAKAEGFKVGVKLVRGAYMEKERERALSRGYPSPIQRDKDATDRDFDAALEWCVAHLDHVSLCAGSHNENSNALLCRNMDKLGIARNDKRVWFAQLLGMSDPVSFNLACANYQVAKYVPYGPIAETIPYLIRRAEENTSVAGQTSRELELIRREKDRRNRKNH